MVFEWLRFQGQGGYSSRGFYKGVGIEAVEGAIVLAFLDLVDLDEEALTPEDAQCFVDELKQRDSETLMSMAHPEEVICMSAPSPTSSMSSPPSSPQDSIMFASTNEDLIKGAFSILDLGRKTVMVLDKKNVLNFGKRTVLAVTKATNPILAKWNIQNAGRKNIL
ncbi:hypothetical protein BG005_009167 [Podila minutissima]|nr:hypothetical protein BG005_009167 [Podila minutissima]